MLPRMLKGWSAQVDGRGFLGRCDSVKLPELTIKEEDYRGGGMDAPVGLDMGMDKLEISITLPDLDPDAVKIFGLMSASTQLVIRGAWQRQGEDAVPGIIRCQGGLKQISREDFKPGEKGGTTLVFNCNRYQEMFNGEELVNIDILNFVRIIGGVDQLASMRAAIGA